ncbi:MAG: uridine monophosphate kinase [Novosphingobium sp.]|nr:uridine monophosphate kinase [Novosphingobium sp.]
MSLPPFKRILLKLSGEVLMGNQQFGIDPEFVAQLAQEVKAARDTGLEICLVIGGGNIFRGMAGAAAGMDRAQADYMGMLATVMNALAMQNALEQAGVHTRVTSVDGVYDSDPKRNKDAKRYDTVDYDTVLADNLKVMDASAVALCRDNGIPIVVFSIREKGNLARVLRGEGVQTIVTGDD